MPQVRIGVGIDFGTTNTVVAIYDGSKVRMLHVDGENIAMPSATYMSNSFEIETGQNAIARYINENVGRKIELVPEHVGEASLAVGQGDSRQGPQMYTESVYSEPRIDLGLQGRLFKGVKRVLGREDTKRLVIFERLFRPAALITPVLVRVREALADKGIDAETCIAGRPVNFEGPQPFANSLAISRLDDAFRNAGFKTRQFVEEPIAAAISYLDANPTHANAYILTTDFGGGTLDFSICHRSQRNSYTVLATHGVAIGGDHIDQKLFEYLLFPLLGQGENWSREGQDRLVRTRFPFDQYEAPLLNWGITYLLNQNRYTAPIFDCIEHGAESAKKKFKRLLQLIQRNLSYEIFGLLDDLKIQLSSTDSAHLDIPELDVDCSLSRKDFEEMLEGFLKQIDSALDETLRLADLRSSEIDIVLRTGGSSLIPAFRNLLQRRFPNRIVNHDPFGSVASGLAIAHRNKFNSEKGIF